MINIEEGCPIVSSFLLTPPRVFINRHVFLFKGFNSLKNTQFQVKLGFALHSFLFSRSYKDTQARVFLWTILRSLPGTRVTIEARLQDQNSIGRTLGENRFFGRFHQKLGFSGGHSTVNLRSLATRILRASYWTGHWGPPIDSGGPRP